MQLLFLAPLIYPSLLQCPGIPRQGNTCHTTLMNVKLFLCTCFMSLSPTAMQNRQKAQCEFLFWWTLQFGFLNPPPPVSHSLRPDSGIWSQRTATVLPDHHAQLQSELHSIVGTVLALWFWSTHFLAFAFSWRWVQFSDCLVFRECSVVAFCGGKTPGVRSFVLFRFQDRIFKFLFLLFISWLLLLLWIIIQLNV